MSRLLELYDDSGAPRRQRLAGPDIKRYAGPAPIIDHQLECDIGLSCRIPHDVGGTPVCNHVPAIDSTSPVLAPRHVAAGILHAELMHGVQHLELLGAHGVGREAGRRLHRNERQKLEQVVLHHVAQRAGCFVELAAVLDTDCFGNP